MCDELMQLCKELMDILNKVEESDSGREFHPTYISSVRALDGARLKIILPRIDEIVNTNTRKD